MKRFLFVGNLLAAVAVAYFLYLAIEHLSVFESVALSVRSLTVMLLAMTGCVLSVTLGALVWLVFLRAVGQESSVVDAITIVFLSQAAKYIPGNVAHHIGRVVLAKQKGFSANATIFSMFMETLWVVAIAAVMALAAIWSVGSDVFGGISHVPEWWVLVGLVGVAIVAPLVGHRLFEHLARWWAGRKGASFKALGMPSLGAFALASLLYVVNYLILGLILQAIAMQVFGAPNASALLLAGIFAVAWVAGFITPGAPAGLGVREVVLIAALTPIYGEEIAIGSATVFRVVSLLGDGSAFLLGLGLNRVGGSRLLML